MLAPVAVDRSPLPPRSWAKTAGFPQVHLSDVAGGEPEGLRPGRIGPVPAPAQAHLLDDKPGERLGVTFRVYPGFPTIFRAFQGFSWVI